MGNFQFFYIFTSHLRLLEGILIDIRKYKFFEIAILSQLEDNMFSLFSNSFKWINLTIYG